MEDILKQLTVIFRDVLDNDDLVITESTVADDVDEWDSLNHIQLVVAIEKHFKVKFGTQEIMQWKNVGEITASIKKRLAT